MEEVPAETVEEPASVPRPLSELAERQGLAGPMLAVAVLGAFLIACIIVLIP